MAGIGPGPFADMMLAYGMVCARICCGWPALRTAPSRATDDPLAWGPLKEKLTAVFLHRTRAEWCDLMEHTDVCFAPVLNMTEAPSHPHAARAMFEKLGGVEQPMPASRYSANVTATPTPPTKAGADGDTLLTALGYTPGRIAALRAGGVVGG